MLPGEETLEFMVYVLRREGDEISQMRSEKEREREKEKEFREVLIFLVKTISI